MCFLSNSSWSNGIRPNIKDLFFSADGQNLLILNRMFADSLMMADGSCLFRQGLHVVADASIVRSFPKDGNDVNDDSSQ